MAVSASADLSLWGRVLSDGHELPPSRVRIAGERILSVTPASAPAPDDVAVTDGWIAPGLIELQVNGAGGVDLTATDDLDHVASVLAQRGITAFCPTIVSSAPGLILERIARYRPRAQDAGAATLGIHVEGPFLDPAHRGVHDPAVLRDATLSEIGAWLAVGPPTIVTLAPDRPGALDAISRLTVAGVVVSVGHSGADVPTAQAALEAGARMATHLFNAMPPLHHRRPGLVGALLASQATLGIIADGIHLDPLTVDLVVRRAGPDRVALVSDALAAAGAPPGPSQLGEQTVISDGSTVRRADGTLAGSARLLDDCVRLVRQWLPDLPPAAVIQMATSTPARLLGLADRGCVRAGGVADLVILDSALQISRTVLRGRWLTPPKRQD